MPPISTSSERERAIRYVTERITVYRRGLRVPNVGRTRAAFYLERIEALTVELGILMAAGEDGDRLARRWCLVAFL